MSGLFVVVMLWNLCFPIPRGPADNGDFVRTFASFSSGPEGLPLWASPAERRLFERRFFRHYHRYWRIDAGVPERAVPSTSRVLYWPARILRPGQPVGLFDLNRNAAYLVLILGAVLLASLSTLSTAPPFLSLAFFAAIMSDVNLSGYLNSFYQDSGACFFLFVLVCGLHVLWQRGRLGDFVRAVAATILLAGTKLAYSVSVAPAAVPLLAGALATGRAGRSVRRNAVVAAICVIGATAGSLFMLPAPELTKIASYHFIFRGALPRLTSAERSDFLAALDIDRRHVEANDLGVWASGSAFRDPALNAKLGIVLQARAIALFVGEHPGTAWALLVRFLGETGQYPSLRQSEEGELARPSWSGWSSLRRTALHGWPAYALGLVFWSALVASAWRKGDRDWLLFFALGSGGFYVGSVVQVLVAAFGEGATDIARHLYFGNLLFDTHFALSVTGLAVLVADQRTARAARLAVGRAS